MSPDEFHEQVIPQVVKKWDEHCFCANSGFRKLLSFNFRDYHICPTALIDSEMLIDAIIRQRFTKCNEPQSHQGEITQAWICPQCNARCSELYAEFSISMYQSSVTFADGPSLTNSGLYLVGFRGFDINEMRSIADFQQAANPIEFIRQLTIAS